MRKLLKSTIHDILVYLKDPSKRWISVGIGLFMIANLVQAVLRGAIYEGAADLNFFLDPAIDIKFFNEDPFVTWPWNSYPAFFYSVMSLLTPFSRWFSSLLWAVLSTLFFIGIIAIVMDLIKQTQPERRQWSYLIGPLFVSFLFAINIHLGQSNLIMLFAIVIGVFYLIKGNNLLTGLYMGFAMAFKTTPMFFLFYFVLKGKFRAAFLSFLFFLIFMVVAPMFFYSPARSISFAKSWYSIVLEPFISGEKVKTKNVGYYHSNQSIDAFLNRHFTPYGLERYGGAHSWLGFPNYTEKEMYSVGKIMKLVLIGLLGFLIFKNRSLGRRIIPYEISIFLLAILFISPVSWVNHYILILPAYIIMVNEIIILPKSHPGRKMLLWPLILSTPVLFIAWFDYLQSFSPFFISQGILFIGLYVYILFYAGRYQIVSIP